MIDKRRPFIPLASLSGSSGLEYGVIVIIMAALGKENRAWDLQNKKKRRLYYRYPLFDLFPSQEHFFIISLLESL